MAHQLLEIGEYGAAFAYNVFGGHPWHRLGKPMEGLQTAEDMLAAAHADYEVKTAPLRVLVPIDKWEPGAVSIADEWYRLLPVPNKQATYAEIGGEMRAFAPVGMRYTTAQNLAVVERGLAIVGAAEGGAYVETAGVLGEGERFFATINLGGLVIDPAGANDRITRYLVISTSHDGSAAIKYVLTDVRVVCNNTLRMALSGAQSTFTAKHTPNHEAKLDEARKILGISIEWAEQFGQMADAMLAIPANSDTVAKVVEKTFPLESNATDRKKRNAADRLDKIQWIFRNERNAGHVGENGWAVFNAITEFLDHHREDDQDKMDLVSMDPDSWVSQAKVRAQNAVLALA